MPLCTKSRVRTPFAAELDLPAPFRAVALRRAGAVERRPLRPAPVQPSWLACIA